MLADVGTIPGYFLSFFLRPVQFARSYDRRNLRPDLLAGITVAVILLPQAIAFALIAELPPEMGLYTAVVGAIIGALWGSSDQLHTGPTNTTSLLILSVLLTVAPPGSPKFLAAAGLVAVMVGVFRLVMGLARLGVLVNFVSDSVIVGFTAGAGVLIGANQLRHLLRLEFPSSPSLGTTLQQILVHLPETHKLTLGLGLAMIVAILLLQRLNPKLPAPLLSMVIVTAIVGVLRLDQQGLEVIGQLPRGLPPLARLPLFDLDLIGELSTGALAVAALGLVESMSIARAIAGQTGQRLDSNQEFVGQGLANIACGFLSGYTCSGSFSRSAVNYKAGSQTPLASVLSGLFVLVAMLIFAPLAAYVPRTSLAAVLIVTAYGMIDRKEMVRIWRGTRGDTLIMVVTLLATLFLPLQFAVLTGILMSFTRYIVKTSLPQVYPVLPDEEFRHLTPNFKGDPCPQLAILTIWGDLYFGAVNQVEEAIYRHLARNPEQRFLLLRMQSVNQCDISGIHMLESILRTCREKGGDLFLMKVHEPVLRLMQSTRFYDKLGADHYLGEDDALSYLFYKILDPAVCIYECEVRAFKECQNLPKRAGPPDLPLFTAIPPDSVDTIAPQELWQALHAGDGALPPLVVDVREPREFKQNHIPQARLLPLPKVLTETQALPADRDLVFVCRSGRRSSRAAYVLRARGYRRIRILQGGMLAWEAAGLLEAVGGSLLDNDYRG